MTSTASPDAPAEVVRRRAHHRYCQAAWWVARGNMTAEQARSAATLLRRRLDAADPTRQPRLCAWLARLAADADARAADAANQAARWQPLAVIAADADARATEVAEVAADHAEALAALLAVAEVLDTPAAEPHRHRLVLDLPPPGRLVRCSPMAAHAPPGARPRGPSGRLGRGRTLLLTTGGT